MLIPTLLAAFSWATPVFLPAASELVAELHPQFEIRFDNK